MPYKSFIAAIVIALVISGCTNEKVPENLVDTAQQAYYKRTNEGGFTKNDFEQITQTENEPNLQEKVNHWLERMPFFDALYWGTEPRMENTHTELHPFWVSYRKIYTNGLNSHEQNKLPDFDYVLFEKIPAGVDNTSLTYLRKNFSPKALRAALFIMLYRDFPVFQTS